MFRRVREAAQRGRTQAKKVLAGLGRGIKKGARVVKRAAIFTGVGAALVVGRVLRTTARGITWTWLTAIEVISLTLSPFVWVLGSGLFALLRGVETLLNKMTGGERGFMHRRYPAFTLLNAVAMTNVDLYPLIAVVGWLLSPLSGKNWWHNLAYGYKVRTLSAADFSYMKRFERDLGFGIKVAEPEEPTTTWEQVPVEQPALDVDEEGLTPLQRYERNMAEGWKLVWPEDKPEGGLDYLTERIRTSTGDEEEVANFLFSIHNDHWGRFWAQVPDGIDTTRPKPSTVEPEEQVHAKHAADDLDEHGLVNFALEDVPDDFQSIADPKERSFWYGATFAMESRKKIKNFLDSEEQQNRARAMVAKDTRNPQSGFLIHYAIKGFEEELARAKEQAAHRV